MTSSTEFDPSSLAPLRADRVLQADLPGGPLTLHSTWGLFSPREIDAGTRLLLDHVDVQRDDVTLDIGCGYGPLGLSIARRTPEGQVHMVDKDYLAVEYTRANAERNQLHNVQAYLSNGLSEVPADLPLTLVVSNLPAKVGNEMFYITFYDAWQRLQPGGRIVVVTINGLRSFIKRAFTDVFGNCKKLKQGQSYTISMATRNE